MLASRADVMAKTSAGNTRPQLFDIPLLRWVLPTPEGPPLLKGRVVRQSGSPVVDIEVVLQLAGDPPLSLPPVRPGDDGRFAIEVTEPVNGPLTLVLSQALFADVSLQLGDGAFDEEVLVVLPDRAVDPRTQVGEVQKLLTAEREASGAARAVLAEEVNRRDADEARIRRVVDTVLASVTQSAGGDVRFKAVRGRSISSLTLDAVREGRRDVSAAPPVITVPEGRLEDGQKLDTGKLVAQLSGAPQPRDGYWRVDPLERLLLRKRHAGPDGLPIPGAQRRAEARRTAEDRPAGISEAASEAIGAAVSDKVEKLVDAMRLPEDPPLLLADAAVTGSGPDVEFARGIADTTAFHDFHELIPALPDVWQEVFDRRFASVVEAAVRELDGAGVPIDDLADAPATDSPGGAPADQLARRLAGLAAVYDTTSAARIRPPNKSMVAPATAIQPGLEHPSGGVLFRVNVNDIAGDSRAGGVVGPSTGVSGNGSGAGSGNGPVDLGDLGVTTGELAPKVQTVPSLLQELEAFLRGEHSFTVFAAEGKQRAINFGVLLTWRHEMEPLNYQVGEIAHTMTLAPGEKRKIVTKRRRSVKRSTAESEKALRSIQSETTDTMRAESEIIRKASASTDFHLSAQGSTNLLVQGGTFTTNGTRKVGRDGNDTRRRFREAVVKAAQEVKNERSMEVKGESEELLEEETTAEVGNPNDEIAMTAVFYTLQRRYRLRERLYRAQPVILVALPVPDPAEITTAWLIRYAWILRRCLLDDRFTVTLDYLTNSFLGDSATLVHLEQAVRKHESALRAAEHRLRSARSIVEHRSKRLSALRKRLAQSSEGGVLEGLFDLPGLNTVADATRFARQLFGGGDSDQEERERRALLLEAVEEDLARSEREARESEAQVAGASNALQEATRDFVTAKSRALNYEVQIAELRVHVSYNILYYMQNVWANQAPDHRYFELHDVLAPVLRDTVRVTKDGVFDQPGLDGITPERFRVDFADQDGEVEFRPLAEICNLNLLIGLWGNLAMFPMKDGNALTDLILAPYIDQHEILRDPEDIAASWTLADLEAYADELREDPEEFERQIPFLRATLERLLTAPRLSEEEIVVPTDSLYVDLLTSSGTLLEPYKMQHRMLDVEKVREELRGEKLESARRAARIAEGDLADPDMDDFERRLVSGDFARTPPRP